MTISSSTPKFLITPILEGHFNTEVPRNSVKMTCPFHADDNPSAAHYDYFFKCFGCGVQGDAIGLLHYQGGLSFADAYKRAEELAGSPDESVSGQRPPGRGLSGGQRVYRGHSRFGSTRRGR